MLRFILIGLILASFVLGAGAQSPDPIEVWIADSVPVPLFNAINPLFNSEKYRWTNDPNTADLQLDFGDGGGAVATQWVYVPIVPFASTAEMIRWEEVRRYWRGEGPALGYLTPDGSAPLLIVSNETLGALTSLLGPPAEGVPLRFVATTAEIAPALWQNRPLAWGMVGFNDLTVESKVLPVDRFNVFSPQFVAEDYPLTATLALRGKDSALGTAMEDLLALQTWPASNRDASRLGRVVLTGVTALTRATDYKIFERGVTALAEGLMPFLADADLLHTSNEVSFSENCPPPDFFASGVIFCSRDSSFALFTHIGLDVIEQTGNHVNDYGPGALRRSLDMYVAAGFGIFGGGYDPADARDAYVTTVNGTQMAFIGCNVPGPFGAFASDTRPGAAPCDDAYLESELNRLSTEYDVVVMAVQEYEYYTYTVGANQLRRFQRYAEWGADVVIGTQAHQPQGFTLYNGAFLHHGLGNLFFDQMDVLATRQMFADKLIVYDGRVISVVLYTGLIEDYCCPRPMTATERSEFLRTIFGASGW